MLAPGKKRLLLIVAIVALAALLGGAYMLFLVQRPGYFRIILPDKRTIFLKYQGERFFAERLFEVEALLGTVHGEYQGNDLRVASSVEGLRDAAPIRAYEHVTLEPASEPPDADKPFSGQIIRAWFKTADIKSDLLGGPAAYLEPSRKFSRVGRGVFGLVQIYRMEDAKTEWACLIKVRSPFGGEPYDAPCVELPTFRTLKLTAHSAPANDMLGIAMRVYADNAELYTLEKCKLSSSEHFGKLYQGSNSPSAEVRVLNESGVAVASKKGLLNDFGFS
jgi:hypothetical protein